MVLYPKIPSFQKVFEILTSATIICKLHRTRSKADWENVVVKEKLKWSRPTLTPFEKWLVLLLNTRSLLLVAAIWQKNWLCKSTSGARANTQDSSFQNSEFWFFHNFLICYRKFFASSNWWWLFFLISGIWTSNWKKNVFDPPGLWCIGNSRKFRSFAGTQDAPLFPI